MPSKIEALFEKAGIKPELAKEITESLASYKSALREQFETEYAAKVEQAKKVCIEETEAHKRELARRLQIFCETKGAAIEATLAKQSALNESAALTKLNNIANILAGLELNGGANGDVTAVVEKFKHKAQVATEEKNQAIEVANRKTSIAEKALNHNRQLTTEVTNLKRQLGGKQTVTEGRQKGGSRRIDQNRSNGQARSTRATILENQDRRPPAKPQQPHVTGSGERKGYSVDNIATSMDEDLI